MKRRLFLHVGVHRTGTTSIQKFMAKNFGMLQQKGIFHPYAVPRHVRLMNEIFSGSLTVADAARDINARADSKAHRIDTVVLSDEDICTRPDPSVLGAFQAHFDVKVILMIRRQDLWLESWHKQNIKWQWNPDLAHLPFEEFLSRREMFFWIHYEKTIERFQALFGEDSVICLPFEPSQMPDGAVMAFCEAIGLSDFEMLKMPQTLNSSLSPVMGEFVRLLPLDTLPVEYRRQVEQACMTADRQVKEHFGDGSDLLMGPAMRRHVLAEYADGNAAVAQARFQRDSLFLEPLPAEDAALASYRLPTDSYRTIEHIVVPFISALTVKLLSEVATLKQTLDTLEDAQKQADTSSETSG